MDIYNGCRLDNGREQPFLFGSAALVFSTQNRSKAGRHTHLFLCLSNHGLELSASNNQRYGVDLFLSQFHSRQRHVYSQLRLFKRRLKLPGLWKKRKRKKLYQSDGR